MKIFKILLSSALICLMSNVLFGQNNETVISKTDQNTGVTVTTVIKQFPSLSEQVADFEKKLADAKLNPLMHQNGTVEKYRIVLEGLRKELEAENAERRRLETVEK